MRQVFESSETEAIILVDVTNTFNSLNRQAALRNIRYLCPPLSKILINTYREDVRLFIDGETLPTVTGRHHSRGSTCYGDVRHSCQSTDPPTKTWHNKTNLVCRRCHCWGKAQQLARMVGLSHQYWPRVWLLPECIKNMAHCEGRIQGWSHIYLWRNPSGHYWGRAEISRIRHRKGNVHRELCTTESHHLDRRVGSPLIHSHHSTTCSLYCFHTWSDKQMDVFSKNHSDLIKPLEETIRKVFLPNLTGQNAFNDMERDLLALPARLGGLGIDPCKKNAVHYSYVRHNLSTSCTLDSRPVRDIYTWSKGSSSKNEK